MEKIMNLLNRHSNRKTIHAFGMGVGLTSIFMVAIGLICKFMGVSSDASLEESLQALGNALAIIRFIPIIYYIGVLLGIVAVVLAAFMYFKKSKTNQSLCDLLIYAGYLVLAAVSYGYISGINMISKAISTGSSSDGFEDAMTALANLATGISKMSDAKTFFYIFVYLGVAVGIYSIVTYFKAPKKEDTTETEVTVPQVNFKDMINKVKSDKKVRSIVIVVIAVIVAAGGFGIYKSMQTTKVDLTSNLKDSITFTGYDGYGSTENPSYNYSASELVEYDSDDEDVVSFLSDVYYVYETSEDATDENYSLDGLSNGDKIYVKAVYDEDTAKSLKINPVNTTLEVEVTGLIERFTNAEDFSEDDIATLKGYYTDTLKAQMKEDNATFVGAYFLSSNDEPSYYNYDKVVYVATEKEEYTYFTFEKTVYYTLSNVDKTLGSDNSNAELYDYYLTLNYDRLDTAKQALSDLKEDCGDNYEVYQLDLGIK